MGAIDGEGYYIRTGTEVKDLKGRALFDFIVFILYIRKSFQTQLSRARTVLLGMDAQSSGLKSDNQERF
jgi:hypothetical protein